MAKKADGFRVRISTALVLVAVVLFLVPATWTSYIPSQPGLLHNAFSWLYFDASSSLFLFAFLIALCSAPVMAYRRNWRGTLQYIFEIAVCIVGVYFTPAY